jgi:hypothetical protein
VEPVDPAVLVPTDVGVQQPIEVPRLELTAVRGIGEVRAKLLEDAGISTVAALAAAPADEVAGALVVGRPTAAAIVADAGRLLPPAMRPPAPP